MNSFTNLSAAALRRGQDARRLAPAGAPRSISKERVHGDCDPTRSSSKVSYPAEAVSRLFAPPESEVPADKLRRLLHEARAKKSFLHTAGAYDAFTSAIMTTLGFKTLYGSGWQLAATKSMYPDIGIYQSHQMVELVLEMRKGIEGARNTRWYDSEGKDLLDAPPGLRGHGGRASAARPRPSPWPPS